MSSKNNEEIGYNLDLDFLTIVDELCVSYPRRSGLVGKK